MRITIFGICLLLATPLLQAKEWAFDVYLDKNKIGTHTFTLSDNTLTSKANFNVKVLFINAYKYDHSAKEQWAGDCLNALEANTIENKIVTKVNGKLDGGAFNIKNGNQEQALPACVMTFAYWNPKILQQSKLLNPQNAEYLDTTITKLGDAKTEVKGKPTDTMHYKITGALKGVKKLNIELWYNQDNDWVALKSVTPEGYNIIYKLK
ncbi:MAG TPA: DUF6134 family protein [Methylotenera sp.]|nr:DUF6134 family protein [Methylotenera sp.]